MMTFEFASGNYRELLLRLYGKSNWDTVSVLIDSYMHLLASSPFDCDKPVRLYQRFSSTLVNDLRGTIARYSSLADDLLKSMVYTSDDTVTGVFLNDMKKTPIFKEYLMFYRTGDASILKYILTFLLFGKKTQLDFSDLADVALRDWLKIEEELSSLRLDDNECRSLRLITSFLLDVSAFDDTLLLPHHGGGQVAEKVESFGEKFDFLTLDTKLAKCFRRDRFLCDHLQNIEHLPMSESLKRSVLRFVPKTYKTYRSICMEPTAYMCFQQEVMRWLVNAMADSRVGKFVDLRRQSANRDAAVAGSLNFSLDTIDLSAASDRVHIDLVRKIFPPKILYYLMGTRSKSVILPDGTIHDLTKFAPMGSALCFPVQCLLFSSIVFAACIMRRQSCTLTELVHHCTPQIMERVFSDLNSQYDDYGDRTFSPRVYGDDIICDSRITDSVTYLLNHFGLSVNVGKSFTGGQMIRESCGIYAYNGYDVTPLLLKIKNGGNGRFDASYYESLISSINLSGDYGFRSLHSWLIGYARERYKPLLQNSDLPFTMDRNAPGIWTKQKREPAYVREHLLPDGKPGWQILEEQVLVVKAKVFDRFTAEEYFYDQWMRSKTRCESKDIIRMSPHGVLPRHMRLSRGWIPVRM